jgi:putative oxidoreductase
MKLITQVNTLLATVGRFLRSPLLLAVRLFWGWHFMGTGWGKLHNLDGVTKYFGSLGIPAPHLNAIMAASTELGGGLLLLLGLLSRFASAALICVMCVAYLTAESDSLHAIFSNPDKFLGADPFLFLYASTLVFAFGPGRLAVDSLIFKEAKP